MSTFKPTLDRRSFIRTLGASSALTLATPAILRAQAQTLKFSSFLPPVSPVRQNFFELWASEIPELTEGRVVVEFLEKPLGPPPAHRDLLRENKADIAYALHGYSPGEFHRAQIGQFSFLGDAYGASHAFSKVYGKLLEAEKEHTGMELMGLFQHGPGVLMLKNKRIDSPEDFKGLRIRTSGGYIGNLIEDLGGINVPMSPTKTRESLLDGTIDGAAFPYEGATSFGFVDEITFISELPGGYYNATWFLGLSEQAAAGLEARDLETIKNYSGQTVHVLAAKTFDYVDYIVKGQFEELGIEIAPTSNEVTAYIKDIAKGYERKWADSLIAEGYDGERALAYTRRMTQGA